MNSNKIICKKSCHRLDRFLKKRPANVELVKSVNVQFVSDELPRNCSQSEAEAVPLVGNQI
jgi:hypothetical protein